MDIFSYTFKFYLCVMNQYFAFTKVMRITDNVPNNGINVSCRGGVTQHDDIEDTNCDSDDEFCSLSLRTVAIVVECPPKATPLSHQ